MDSEFFEDLGFVRVPKNVEYWIPSEEKSLFSQKEWDDLLREKEAIVSLHIVIPSLLIELPENRMGHSPYHELGYYLIAAQLKGGGQMVIVEGHKKSKEMHKHLMETIDAASCFYIDHHVGPNFGCYVPKNIIFERVDSLEEGVPDTMVLFKESF